MWGGPHIEPRTIILREPRHTDSYACQWYQEPKVGPEGGVYCGISVPLLLSAAAIGVTIMVSMKR